MASDSSSMVTHPAPHRGRVSLSSLMFGLWGAPAAWGVQLVVNYGLASHACFPMDLPRSSALPGWGWVPSGLIAVNILALAIAAWAAWISWRNWRATREEMTGHRHHPLETGAGRTRFLSLWGLMSGLGFLVGTAFDTIAVFGVPLC